MPESSFEREVLDRLTKIESKLDGYGKLKETVYESARLCQQNTDDIAEIKDNYKWLWRTVIGAIIVAVVGVLVTLF